MVVTRRIAIRTRGEGHMVDVTREVGREVAASGVRAGTATVFVSGSTAGVTTIEYEPGLEADFAALWDRLVPRDITYRHDQRWGDGNGYAHVRASLLGPSLVVPVVEGRPELGTWQQIVVVDFDNRPRSREVVVQVMGE